MPRLRWGIKTSPQHTTYEALRDVWREADQNTAFEHAWLFDHFNPIQGSLDGPCFEGWTLLSARSSSGASNVPGHSWPHAGAPTVSSGPRRSAGTSGRSSTAWSPAWC